MITKKDLYDMVDELNQVEKGLVFALHRKGTIYTLLQRHEDDRVSFCFGYYSYESKSNLYRAMYYFLFALKIKKQKKKIFKICNLDLYSKENICDTKTKRKKETSAKICHG